MRVAIVGGGVIGLATAWSLARRGAGVTVEMHADGLLYLMRDEHELGEWLGAYAELETLGFDGQLTVLDRAGVQSLEPAVAEGVVAGVLAGRERHVRPESLTAGLVDD